MSARQFGIQSRQDKREQARFKRDVMRGLNPMSPQAIGLHPNAAKMFQQNMGNKMQNPLSASPERTLAGQQQSAANLADMAVNNPSISGLGVDPAQGMRGIHQALTSRIDEDPNLTVTDDDLVAYQKYAREMDNLSTDQNNQFDFGNTPEAKYESGLWKELAGLPDTEQARAEWLDRYKKRKQGAAEQWRSSQPPMTPLYRGGPIRTGA